MLVKYFVSEEVVELQKVDFVLKAHQSYLLVKWETQNYKEN